MISDKCPKISNILFHRFLALILLCMHFCPKILSGIAKSVDPDQTALQELSCMGLHCFHRPFCQKLWCMEV